MTSSGNGNADPNGEAGEYVIGTLDREERAAFAARLHDDPAAQRAVAEWERRFAALDVAVDAVAPQPDTWSRIERTLRLADGKLQRFRVIEGGGQRSAVNDYVTSRNRWRAVALVSGAIAASLLIFVVARDGSFLQRGGMHRTLMAAVNRGGDKPALIVRVNLDTKQVLVRPVSATAPPGRSLELWCIADGYTPRSMGLVKNTPESMPLPPNTDLGDNTTFAVSVEPEGGSKSGGPTGPVLYSGSLIAD